jgi:hypothetical protein
LCILVELDRWDFIFFLYDRQFFAHATKHASSRGVSAEYVDEFAASLHSYSDITRRLAYFIHHICSRAARDEQGCARFLTIRRRRV